MAASAALTSFTFPPPTATSATGSSSSSTVSPWFFDVYRPSLPLYYPQWKLDPWLTALHRFREPCQYEYKPMHDRKTWQSERAQTHQCIYLRTWYDRLYALSHGDDDDARSSGGHKHRAVRFRCMPIFSWQSGSTARRRHEVATKSHAFESLMATLMVGMTLMRQACAFESSSPPATVEHLQAATVAYKDAASMFQAAQVVLTAWTGRPIRQPPVAACATSAKLAGATQQDYATGVPELAPEFSRAMAVLALTEQRRTAVLMVATRDQTASADFVASTLDFSRSSSSSSSSSSGSGGDRVSALLLKVSKTIKNESAEWASMSADYMTVLTLLLPLLLTMSRELPAYVFWRWREATERAYVLRLRDLHLSGEYDSLAVGVALRTHVQQLVFRETAQLFVRCQTEYVSWPIDRRSASASSSTELSIVHDMDCTACFNVQGTTYENKRNVIELVDQKDAAVVALTLAKTRPCCALPLNEFCSVDSGNLLTDQLLQQLIKKTFALNAEMVSTHFLFMLTDAIKHYERAWTPTGRVVPRSACTLTPSETTVKATPMDTHWVLKDSAFLKIYKV